MNAAIQNLGDSLTGNLPKAILCVRNIPESGVPGPGSENDAGRLRGNLLEDAQNALNGHGVSTAASHTFRSLTGKNGIMANSGYLALEVQYNPGAIYLETQAGIQMDYGGGELGNRSNNNIIQTNRPVSTTLSLQLVFDDMNPSDAFMMENTALTLGNAVSAAGSTVKKLGGRQYSVQPQIDGILSLLTMDKTKDVLFYWAQMCFSGTLYSINSRYTMFNKDGNPIRGVVEMAIRQGSRGVNAFSDASYWNQAFNKAFGNAYQNVTSGMASGFGKATNNNLLNINI